MHNDDDDDDTLSASNLQWIESVNSQKSTSAGIETERWKDDELYEGNYTKINLTWNMMHVIFYIIWYMHVILYILWYM